MSVLAAAVILGLLGSFHCIGMCGPIALSLPIHRYSPLKKHAGILVYNIGRLLTYSLLGLVFGLLGQSFFIGGFQQVLSIGIGSLLLLSVIFSQTASARYFRLPFLYPLVNRLKYNLGILFNKQSMVFLLLIGLLNGLLPCGLVYLGIAGAMATGHYISGTEFMFCFGLGTIPVMYLVAFLGQFIKLSYRNVIRRSMPYVVSATALLLIVRGLNLGIPYLSPAFEKKNNTVSCCEKPLDTKLSARPAKSCCTKNPALIK